MRDDSTRRSRVRTRRNFLKTAGVASAVALAGCGGDGGDGGDGSDGGDGGSGDGNNGGNGGSDGGSTDQDSDLSEIVVYTNVPFEDIANAYEEDTGNPISYNLLGGPQPVTQYLAEAEQEQYGTDIIYNNSGITWQLHENDIVSEFNVEQELLDNVYKFDGMKSAWEDALGSDVSRLTPPGQVLVNANFYNTNLVDDPPLEFQDLLGSTYEEQMTTQPFITDATLQTLEHYHGTDTAEEWIQEYDDLGIDYVTGGGTVVEQVLGQQNMLGTYTNAFYASTPINDGAPFDLEFPKETWYLAQTLCKPQNAPSPEAADEFCRWFLSEPGQEQIQQVNGGSLPALQGMNYGNDTVQQRLDERLERYPDTELYPMANNGETYQEYVQRIEELIGVTW